jgi:hypothetical protein
MEHFARTHVPTAAWRVARGVSLLDRYAPVNWHRLVNLVALNIDDYRACIVAQVMGDGRYTEGVDNLVSLGATDLYDTAAKYGFASHAGDPMNDTALTDEWKRVIQNRLDAWERELLGLTGSTVIFTTTDGRTVSFDNVIVDSVGNGAMEHGVVGLEFADGSDRVIHVPFVSHWEFTH